MSAGQWSEAARIFDEIAREQEHSDEFSVPSLLQASSAHLRMGEYRKAHRYALDAAAVRPPHANLLQATAQALNTFSEPERLRALVDSTHLDDTTPGVLIELAQSLSGFGMHDRAAGVLKHIENRAVDTPHSLYLRGLIHMFQGRLQECEAELQRCLLQSSDFAPAYWLLSQVASPDAAPERAKLLNDMLADGTWNDAALGYMEYALHNELHEIGNYEASWEALARGCRARRRVVSWNREDASRLFASMKMTGFSEGTGEQGDVGPIPIFIVGMHRSGTSLLERILGGHSQVADGGESYAFGAQVRRSTDRYFVDMPDPETIRRLRTVDLEELGRNYIESVRWRANGQRFLTEKLPSNFIFAGVIAEALPQAKILHMVRDPVDTCFSNLRTYFSSAAAYSYDQIELAEYYAQYQSLMSHWNSTMPSRIMAVSYDDLVHETQATARRVFDFCGLAYEEDALQVNRDSGSVSTASTVTVRQGIRKDRGAAWKPYEARLQPMIGHLRASGLI